MIINFWYFDFTTNFLVLTRNGFRDFAQWEESSFSTKPLNNASTINLIQVPFLLCPNAVYITSVKLERLSLMRKTVPFTIRWQGRNPCSHACHQSRLHIEEWERNNRPRNPDECQRRKLAVKKLQIPWEQQTESIIVNQNRGIIQETRCTMHCTCVL